MRKVAVVIALLCLAPIFFEGSDAQEKGKKTTLSFAMTCPTVSNDPYLDSHKPMGTISAGAEIAVYAVGMDTPYPIIPATTTISSGTWESTYDNSLNTSMGHWVIADAWEGSEFDSNQVPVEVSSTGQECPLRIDAFKGLIAKGSLPDTKESKLVIGAKSHTITVPDWRPGYAVGYIYKRVNPTTTKVLRAVRQRHPKRGDLDLTIPTPNGLTRPYVVVVRNIGQPKLHIKPVNP